MTQNVSRETLSAPLTPDDFARATHVSRETLARLTRYADLLSRWQRRMNLVAPDSLNDLWRRHFLDSAQLFPLVPDRAAALADLGSGAGFPGLVLAILGAEAVTLVESNGRKAAFLREAARATETNVTIFSGRIEHFSPPRPFSVVTARALTGLDKLLAWARPLLAPDGICLFLKGQSVADELTVAEKTWHMSVERIASATDDRGTILRIHGLKRKGPP